MSVKFEKDTFTQTAAAATAQGATTMKGPLHELADEAGVALTGGKGNVGQGYLAVCDRTHCVVKIEANNVPAGLPQAIANQSSAYEDAYVRYFVCVTRNHCFLDRQRYQQTWSLFHSSSPQDGRIWSIHKRTSGPCLDQHPSEVVRRTYEFEGKNYANSDQQFSCMCCYFSPLSVHC